MTDDRLSEWVLRPELRRRHEPDELRPGHRRIERHDVCHSRLAPGQRAGLVEDDGADLVETLERLGVPEQDAVLRSLARADHDRCRRRKAERTRTRHDEHGDRVDEREVERRGRAERKPGDERQAGDGEHTGDEVAGHDVGEALDGSLRALGVLDEPHDLGKDGVAPDAGCLERERARAVERPADDLVAGFLSTTGRLSPVTMLSSIELRPLAHETVDRDLLARR